ncbi:hypothetical protein D3C77_470610 [compost metagenome]
MGFAVKGEGDGLEIVDGARHAAQHFAELAHLGDSRFDPHRLAEVEIGQRADLMGQRLQGLTDAPGQKPAHQQKQRDQHAGPHGLFHQYPPRAHQQLAGRNRDQHVQVMLGKGRQGHTHAIPVLATRLIAHRLLALVVTGGQPVEAVHAQFFKARQSQRVAILDHYPLQILIDDDAA